MESDVRNHMMIKTSFQVKSSDSDRPFEFLVSKAEQ